MSIGNKKIKSSSSKKYQNGWVSCLLIISCFFALLGVRLFVNHPITGDEPHYLLMDYGMVHYRSLNLKKDYEDRDYWSFYPALLSPANQVDESQLTSNSSKLYSIHGPGLPILLLPGFILGQKEGAVIEMVGIAAIVIWLTHIWTNLVVKNRKVSIVACGLLTICFFFNGLAGYIYPDMVIAGLTLASLIIIEGYYDVPIYQLVFGLLAGFMLLVHFKTLAIAAPLFLVLIVKLRRNKRKFPWWALLSGGILAAVFLISFVKWYGFIDPTKILSPANGSITSPLRTIPAILFDSNRGLLIYNPILLLIFVGLVPWFKRRKENFIITLIVLAPSVLLLTIYNEWQGGYAPFGRYLIDFLPVLTPALAYALILMKSLWQRLLVAVLAILTLSISVYLSAIRLSYIDPEAYRTKPVLFVNLDRYTHIAIQHLLPSYSNESTLNDRYGFLKVAIGSIVVLLLVVYGHYLSSPQKKLARHSR